MIIYKAINKINGKVYIGLTTKSLEWRIMKHRQDHNRPNVHKAYLYRAMRKYGFENFTWEVIDTATSLKELHDKEKYWIEYYGSFNDKSKGYNSTSGGEGMYQLTDEERVARSERAKGEKNPMYGVPSPMKGKKFSEEHKRKISEALSKADRPHLHGGTNPSARKVRNIDTGEVFETMKSAYESCGLKSHSGIYQACKYKSKTAGGYRWEYVD